MISAYNQIVEYEEDNWEDYLTQLCIIDIFKDLLLLYTDKPTLKQVIRYIVWGYSKDSDCVILGMDWMENKKRIFDKAFLEDKHFNNLVLLESDVILKTIQRWMDFQDSSIFSHLSMLKDLQIEMRLSANSPIRKASLEIDYDQKFKNAEYVQQLRKMISDLETELIANNPKLKDAYKDVKNVSKKNTRSVEQMMTSNG